MEINVADHEKNPNLNRRERIRTHQNNTTAPDINLAASVKQVTDDKLWSCITRTPTAGLHQITSSVPTWQNLIQLRSLDEIPRVQLMLNLLS